MQDEIKKVNLELMRTADAAYLTTIGEDGRPYTRAMLNLRNEGQFPKQAKLCGNSGFSTLLSTNTSSRKVSHIKNNPHVSVYYCRPRQFHGLMLSGEMEVVSDPELRHALWEDGWERYYPAGKDDPDYTILHLRPQFAQGWFQGRHFYFDL